MQSFDLSLAHIGWMPPLAARAMEAQELDNEVAIGLFGCHSAVQRAHLVAKPIEQLLAPAAGVRLCIARKRRTIRRCAVFPEACESAWSAIKMLT
jgi:hypothetical protein